MRVYLDIETYRPGTAFKDEKIIAIGVLEDYTRYMPSSATVWEPPMVKLRLFTEWGSGGEEGMLRSFNHYLRDLLTMLELGEEPFIVMVGFNILRFDIPLIIQRTVMHGIAPLEELNTMIHRIYTIDLLQALLPLNGMRFKGLTLDHTIDMLRQHGVDTPATRHGTGRDIQRWYRKRDYANIERHLIEDLKTTRILDLHLPLLYKPAPAETPHPRTNVHS